MSALLANARSSPGIGGAAGMARFRAVFVDPESGNISYAECSKLARGAGAILGLIFQ